MGIRNWLFGKTEEVLHPPPLRTSAALSHQSQHQGDVERRSIQVLKASDAQALASRHGVSPGAIQTLADALTHSQGRAAQFSHPELGGMGQWMSGGMLMIGDMFNQELKAKVDRLCHDVAAAIAASLRAVEEARAETRGDPISWWPAGLGTPAAAGSQNEMRYAFFPAAKRLVIDDNGAVSMYDTGDAYLTGISQQQSTTQTLSFSSTDGPVPLSRFKLVTASTA